MAKFKIFLCPGCKRVKKFDKWVYLTVAEIEEQNNILVNDLETEDKFCPECGG